MAILEAGAVATVGANADPLPAEVAALYAPGPRASSRPPEAPRLEAGRPK